MGTWEWVGSLGQKLATAVMNYSIVGMELGFQINSSKQEEIKGVREKEEDSSWSQEQSTGIWQMSQMWKCSMERKVDTFL